MVKIGRILTREQMIGLSMFEIFANTENPNAVSFIFENECLWQQHVLAVTFYNFKTQKYTRHFFIKQKMKKRQATLTSFSARYRWILIKTSERKCCQVTHEKRHWKYHHYRSTHQKRLIMIDFWRYNATCGNPVRSSTTGKQLSTAPT